ncbi:MAG: STT3 domain-containing protein [Acidilobaceae archaeon]
MSNPSIQGYARFILFIARISVIIAITSLILLLALGFYLRILPAIKYGLELDEADPWIMYWIAEQFYTNGLFSFNELRGSKLFWYPYGRNFLSQEYIGTAWIATATYHLVKFTGITLKDWIALFPVFAGILAAFLSYVLVWVLTGSRLGGLVSVALFSLLPGAIGRTTVGFVEKMVIALVFMTLFYILLALALSSRGKARILYSILAGLSAGFISFIWGGYHFIAVSFTLIILLDPLIHGGSDKSRLLVYSLISIPFIVLASIYPGVGYDYFISGLGFSVIASLILYAIISFWDKSGLGAKLFPFNRLLYAWILASGIIGGLALIVTGALSVPGRLLLALGIREFSPLAESVAEHASLAWSELFREIGVSLLITVIGLMYYAYKLYSGRRYPVDHLILSLFIMALIITYAAKNMAYFLQVASYYTSLTAGLAVGLWMSSEKIVLEGKRRGSIVVDDMRLFIALVIIVIVLLSSAYYAKSSYDVNSLRAPQILTSGLSVFFRGGEALVPINDAWIRALEYIRANTSEDALIVSWWDYGYWISVIGRRPSVADGSTWNETQIRILARILTGDEDEASELLQLFKAKPNNTYIVFYEGYILVRLQNTTDVFAMPIFTQQIQGANFIVMHGVADFPKSFQMLRIGYRIDPFAPSPFGTAYSSQVISSQFRSLHFPGFIGSPEGNVRLVLNSLIYKFGLEGLTHIPNKGIASKCPTLSDRNVNVIPMVYDPAMGQPIPVLNIGGSKRFSPEAIIVSCFASETTTDRVQDYAVIVFIYRWLG